MAVFYSFRERERVCLFKLKRATLLAFHMPVQMAFSQFHVKPQHVFFHIFLRSKILNRQRADVVLIDKQQFIYILVLVVRLNVYIHFICHLAPSLRPISPFSNVLIAWTCIVNIESPIRRPITSNSGKSFKSQLVELLLQSYIYVCDSIHSKVLKSNGILFLCQTIFLSLFLRIKNKNKTSNQKIKNFKPNDITQHLRFTTDGKLSSPPQKKVNNWKSFQQLNTVKLNKKSTWIIGFQVFQQLKQQQKTYLKLNNNKQKKYKSFLENH